MRTTGILVITALASVTLAAQGGGQETGSARGQGGGDAKAAITRVADGYVKATLAGDAKAVAALYTEDAVEMPPNAPLVKGRAAIEEYYQKIFSSGAKVTGFTLSHLETRSAGDNGYDVGTYQQSMTPPGGSAANKETGKYVVILKRAGGAWKVAYAIYSSDQPPPAR